MLRLIRENRGQALVEMALVLPFLIFILLAVMEGGRLFASYLELENAAREGARNASIGMSDVETTVYAKEQLKLINPDTVRVEFDPEVVPPNVRQTGEQVAVAIYHDMDILTPIISDIIGNPFPMRARVIMRVE